MRHAVATGGVLPVDPEHAVLVGIERRRLAVPLQIGSRHLEIIERALALDELQMHEPAGRVVDISGPTVTSLSGVYRPDSQNDRLWNFLLSYP